MATPAWSKAEFRLFVPRLAALTDDVIDFWSERAAEQIDDRVFVDLTKQAGMNLTAHLAVYNGAAAALGIPAPGSGGGGLGAMTSVSVGQVSASFASLATQPGLGGAQSAPLALTSWGLEYMRLVHLRGGGPWLADLGT